MNKYYDSSKIYWGCVFVVFFILSLIYMIMAGEDFDYEDYTLLSIAYSFSIIVVSIIVLLIYIKIKEYHVKSNPLYRSGLEHSFSAFVRGLNKYYEFEPVYSASTIKAHPFYISIGFKYIKVCWNYTYVWKYDNDTILGTDDAKRLLSTIIQIQSLNLARTPEEHEKKELILNRIYSYEYESFLFDIFSEKCSYSERYGYNLLDCRQTGIPYNDFKERLINKFELTEHEAKNLISEMEHNHLIVACYSNVIELGSTLTTYWNICTSDDMNINRFCFERKMNTH